MFFRFVFSFFFTFFFFFLFIYLNLCCVSCANKDYYYYYIGRFGADRRVYGRRTLLSVNRALVRMSRGSVSCHGAVPTFVACRRVETTLRLAVQHRRVDVAVRVVSAVIAVGRPPALPSPRSAGRQVRDHQFVEVRRLVAADWSRRVT